MFVREEQAAIDGDPVAECRRRDTFICCLLLCLFKNALEPTAETSIYICHRSEGGEGGPTRHIMGFNICPGYGDRWDVSPVCSFAGFSFLISMLNSDSHRRRDSRGETHIIWDCLLNILNISNSTVI